MIFTNDLNVDQGNLLSYNYVTEVIQEEQVMNTISLKLPKALDTKLAMTAKRRGASKSAIIREAIEDYFARNGSAPSLSAADLAKELIGCIDGGPPDLSYNKKYMKGFGK